MFLFSVSFAQRQDSKEIVGPELEYENSATFFPEANHYSLPRQGLINEQLNNKPLYSGSVRNGKLHGEWQSWYQDGLRCDSGKLVKGLPDGVWKYWDSNGNLIALRSYSADKYYRVKNEMIRYHPKRISFPLTQLYHRNKPAALKYIEAFYLFGVAGRKEPLPELVTKNITSGNAYKPVFDHALHHGLFINFSPDGSIKDSGYYKNGLRQGLWVHKDTSKKIMLKGSYINGQKSKEWKVYDDSGKLYEIIFYTPKGDVKWRKRFQKKGSSVDGI